MGLVGTEDPPSPLSRVLLGYSGDAVIAAATLPPETKTRIRFLFVLDLFAFSEAGCQCHVVWNKL